MAKCRKEGESVSECMERKIPELIEEGMSQEQAIVVARSMCETACSNASFDEVEVGTTCVALPVANYPHMHTFKKGDSTTTQDAHQGGELHSHPILADGTIGEAAGHTHPVTCIEEEE